MIDLRNTINLMTSSDYKARFIAEYWQTRIRYEKLKDLNTRIKASRILKEEGAAKQLIPPAHDCPESVLREQQRIMGEYLSILELRSKIEGVSLEVVEDSSPGSPPMAISEVDGASTRKKVDKGKVLALGKAGWNAKDIADEVGCTESYVRKIVKEAIEGDQGAT